MRVPIRVSTSFVFQHLMNEFGNVYWTAEGSHPPEGEWVEFLESLSTTDDWAILPGTYRVIRYMENIHSHSDRGLAAELWSCERRKKEIYEVERFKPEGDGRQVDYHAIKKGVSSGEYPVLDIV